jgi:O-antigen ligase
MTMAHNGRESASTDVIFSQVKASAPRAIHRILIAATLLSIGWGTLAFGSVYRWAYLPLAGACAVTGLVALAAGRRGRPPIGALAIGFAAILLATGLQLVPLSLPTLLRVSPATDAFLTQYDFTYQLAPVPHPISIAPGKTMTGALLCGALALFLLGTTRLLSVVGARRVTWWLIPFGGVLAAFGIVQRLMTQGDARPLIYGFWQPRFESNPFGPFVNPNHFGGWMLMAIPMVLATLLDEMARTSEAAAEGRDRIGVFASSSLGVILLLGFTTAVMGLSLLMTQSRSAMAAFAVGCLLAGWIAFRRQASGLARGVTIATILLLLIGVFGWAGYDTITSKFTEGAQTRGLGSRRQQAWLDTVDIIRRFPLTGSGMNTFGTAMMVYQSSNPARHLQEAHNDYLQLASEGGVLVGVPILAVIGLFIRDVRRRFREAPKTGSTYYLRLGAVVGIISIALQSLVEFSLQMPGNAAFFTLLAAIALHQSPNLPARSSTAVRR